MGRAEPEKPVARVEQVLGIRIELLEHLRPVQEQVQEHRVRHQFRNLPDRIVPDLEGGEPAEHLEDDEENRGTRAEGRREELRREDRRIPVRTGGQAVEQERRDGVDADRHRDRQQHEGHDQPLLVRPAVEGPAQDVCHDDEVDGEVQVEHEHVPRQDRPREVQVAPRRDQVPEAIRPSEIHDDEEQAHDDGAHRQQLAVDDDLANRLPVVDVGRDHQDHGRGGDADEEREVPDVEAPADLIAHRGDRQSVRDLAGVCEDARQDQPDEQHEPGPVGGVAAERQRRAPAHEPSELSHRGHRALTWRRSRRTSAACSGPPSGPARACAR